MRLLATDCAVITSITRDNSINIFNSSNISIHCTNICDTVIDKFLITLSIPSNFGVQTF